MSWLNDLDPAQETANAANALTFTDKPPAPRMFQGGWSALGQGTMAGGAESARALGVIGGMAPPLVFDRAFMGGEQSDAYYRAMESVTQPALDYWKPDPETTGKASEILFGGARFLVPLMLTPGSPAGIVAAEQTNRTIDLGAQGVDDATAIKGGIISGVTVGAGGIVPGSGIVKGKAADLLATIGINTGLGAGERYATNQLLEANGYTEQAAQYQALDGQAMAADVVLGSLFWGASRLGSPTATPEQVDAALTVEAEVHRRTSSGPGLPVDPASAKANADALDTAIQSLLRGEKVDVGEAIRNATFLRLPRAEVSPALRREYEPAPEGRAAVIAAAVDRTIGLESAGVADARNPNSTATGLGQFIEATWLDVLQRNRPDLAEGRTRAELLALRTDPELSRELTTRFTEENAGALESAGIPVSEQSLYMAHHFGAGGAVKMLRADPARSVSEFLSAKEMKANPHLKGKTVAQAMDDFERRAGRTPRPRMATPDDVAATAFAEKARKYGVEEEAILELTPSVPRDAVTGFVDGRTDSVKSGAVERAKAYIAETGQDGHYVSADIFNLGGLNEAMGNDAGKANVHYRAIAEIVAEELRVSGADVVPMRTGGDEFGAVVAGVDGPTLEAAIGRAQDRIASYTKEQGLSEIANPKAPDAKGTGLHIGTARITPSQSVDSIFSRADAGVDLSKKVAKGGSRVNRSASGKAGADAPGGQARGTAGRARAPGVGVRQPSGFGAAGIEGSPAQGAAAAQGVARPTPSVMDPDGPPPKTGASGLPDTPAITAAAEAATLNPSLNIVLDDGTVVSAADALATLAKEQAQVEIDAGGYLAAANCFLRSA